MAGLTLQVFDVASKIVLDEFLLDAQLKSIGHLDDSLNNEDYNYVTLTDTVATPWRQFNPVKPIGAREVYLKTLDMLLVYPLDPAVQQAIKQMPRAERAILYVGPFAIRATLKLGRETNLSSAMDAYTRRFMSIADVSVFPLFPASATLPELMPVALLNRARVTHYHACEE